MIRKSKIDPRVEKIIFDYKILKKRIKLAADWINKKYKSTTPILVPILKGAIPFYAELIKHMTIDSKTDFLVYSSYAGGVTNKSKTMPNVITDIKTNIEGKDVIIIEDIIDTGYTLQNIYNFLKLKNPKSLTIMVLINKPLKRKAKIEPNYSCFKINNEFIVGFGFDYKEMLRNLPYIGVLKNELYLQSLKEENQNS